MVSLEVPPQWKQLDLEQMAGTIVVIGQTDSGKSTFVRWLVSTHEMTVLTPARDAVQIASLRIGSLRLNPVSGEELRYF